MAVEKRMILFNFLVNKTEMKIIEKGSKHGKTSKSELVRSAAIEKSEKLITEAEGDKQ